MNDFIELTLEDGTQVLFQTAESNLVQNHGGEVVVEKATAAMSRIQAIAQATESVCKSFREKLAPDELMMEIGIGLSGEVGWFFAKSEVEATLKVTVTWKRGS
jgi:hypothetical protein